MEDKSYYKQHPADNNHCFIRYGSGFMQLFQKYLPKEKHFDVTGSHDMHSMWELSRKELAEGTLLLVVGSLYMVGEILGYMET